MADGFFFAGGDPDPSKIKAQKALAQALMQKGLGDPGSTPYGGISNAVNEVVGAYLNSKSDKANSADYARQIGALLGKDQPNAVQVTPQVQADASGAPMPTDPTSYNQPASTFQGGSLGLAPDKAKLLASVLGGVDPDQGRQALTGLAMDQLTPKPLQFHAPTENAYDAQGNIVVHGTPPEAKPPTTTGGMQWDPKTGWTPIPRYVEQQLAIANARGDAAVAHRAPPRGGAGHGAAFVPTYGKPVL